MTFKVLKRLLLVLSLASVVAACGDDTDADGGGGGGGGGDAGVRPDGGGGDDECFDGTPTTELHLLNACPTTGCIPFDNATRIPADQLALVP